MVNIRNHIKISQINAALLLATPPLLLTPILSIIFGESKKSMTIYLLFSMLFLTFGTSGLIKASVTTINKILIALFYFIVGLIFYINPIYFISFLPLKYSIVPFIFLTQIFIGDLVNRSVYKEDSFNAAYLKIHFYAALLVLLYFIFSIPAHALSFVTSAFIILNPSFFDKKTTFKKIEFDFLSIFSGCISAGFVCIFLEIFHISFYPTGFEQIEYFFLVYLFLLFAPKFAKIAHKRFESIQLLYFAKILFLSTLAVIFFLSPNSSYFNIRSIYFYFFTNNYSALAAFFFILLFFPYLIFSILLPLRQLENSLKNHLFCFSVGNMLGFFFFGFALQDKDLIIKIALSSILLIFGSWIFQKSKLFLLRLISIALTLFFVIASISKPLEETFITYGQLLRPIARDNSLMKKEDTFFSNLPKVNIHSLFREDGELGYVLSFDDHNHYLGLNSYTALIENTDDLERSNLFLKLNLSKSSKVLLVGLGNHLYLKKLLEYFDKVEIVDVFRVFKNRDFLNTVAKINNFSWNTQKADLIVNDAFSFLSKQNKVKYDFIVLNLTSTHYPPSQKTAAIEFIHLLKERLNNNGLIFSSVSFKKVFDCPLVNQFRNSFFADLNTDNNIIVATDSELYTQKIAKLNLKKITIEDCRSAKVLTLKNSVETIKNTLSFKLKDFIPH